MSMVGIATHFLGIFTVRTFVFLIQCLFCESSVFYHEIFSCTFS